ncbi:hypothetical protein [Kitasatospora sp. NPDC094016]
MGFNHVGSVIAVPDKPNRFRVFSDTDHRRVEISEWERLTKG